MLMFEAVNVEVATFVFFFFFQLCNHMNAHISTSFSIKNLYISIKTLENQKTFWWIQKTVKLHTKQPQSTNKNDCSENELQRRLQLIILTPKCRQFFSLKAQKNNSKKLWKFKLNLKLKFLVNAAHSANKLLRLLYNFSQKFSSHFGWKIQKKLSNFSALHVFNANLN
jgi:hypothetical protein